jgi:hypothetical protein
VNTRIVDAERNRPADLAPTAPRLPQVEAMRETLRALVATGLAPERVAELVVDAIRAERFWVLTHGEWAPMLERRMRDVVEGRNPTFQAFTR